jgi:hypothetical protein
VLKKHQFVIFQKEAAVKNNFEKLISENIVSKAFSLSLSLSLSFFYNLFI